MRSAIGLLAVLLTAGVLAGPAHARQGTGLYAPFPTPDGGGRAERFAGELGVKDAAVLLRHGAVVADGPLGAAPRGAHAASARAGLRGAGAPGAVGGLLAALLAAAGAYALAGRRSTA